MQWLLGVNMEDSTLENPGEIETVNPTAGQASREQRQ